MAGELIAGRYELEELIARGGMADVFRARDRLLDRPVAVKVLNERYGDDPDFVERFRREAEAVAQLGHPNIVTVLDRGEQEDRHYIVFELLRGEDLKTYLGRRGPLPVATAVSLTTQVGRALAFAHAHGVVHRDVKPHNVMVDDGRAKVADFGIARASGTEDLTVAGTVLGTGDYLSPEQASGLPADERSDVYSLGILLYELLTGNVPFPADDPVAAAARRSLEEAPRVSSRRADVPAAVDAAVARALERDPARRFQTMDAFVAALGGERAGRTDSQATVALPPPARRRRGLVLLPAAAAVALGAIAAATLIGGGEGRKPPFAPASAAAARVPLRAVAAYDPQGDGHEHDERVDLATDGNPSTYWATEHYSSAHFGNLKSGVGLVLDAGQATRLRRIVLRTDTPGFAAEIQAGDSSAGPFSPASGIEVVGASGSFTLQLSSSRRYYLIWITELPPSGEAHVNEVQGTE